MDTNSLSFHSDFSSLLIVVTVASISATFSDALQAIKKKHMLHFVFLLSIGGIPRCINFGTFSQKVLDSFSRNLGLFLKNIGTFSQKFWDFSSIFWAAFSKIFGTFSR